MVETMNKVVIPSKAKCRVIWEDNPENYTKERANRIAKYFVEKYNNPNIQVIFKPKKVNTEHGEVEMTVADNVMDISYQRKLFKEWVKINDVSVDWERLLRLDDKVNEKLSQQRETDYRYRNWYVKELEWSNFLSYGDGNKITFKELEGITVITSEPKNMGGKCLRGNTEINISYDTDFIVSKLGFLPDELKCVFLKEGELKQNMTPTKKITLKQIDDLFKKYGDLGIKVETPYGYKKIVMSDITAKDSKVLELKLNNGFKIEGSPDHKVKTKNGSFVKLKDLTNDMVIQTSEGNQKIDYIRVLDFTEDLYDIEVAEVKQYYSNGIVSHNSTMAMDLLLFLFFNTTTKGNTALKMFNLFRDKDEVSVKGKIAIDGVDYIIERTVIRKLKRNGSEYSVKTELSFYRILPDGSIENLEGEQRRETEEFIKKSIGSVDDFLLTIIADADNLENIIHTKPTEKGRILSRFIGLEVIEDKEDIVKEMKSSWSKGLKSDMYNITDLSTEIKDLKELIETKNYKIKETEEETEVLLNKISTTISKKEDLISKKIEIDSEVINLRPEDIDRELDDITNKGTKKKEEYELVYEIFKKMVEPDYDEELHKGYVKKEREVNLEIEKIKTNIKRTESLIKNLEEGEFCSLCKQPLADVDHSDEIKHNKEILIEYNQSLEATKKELEEITDLVIKQDELKSLVSEYDRTNLKVSKLELDLERLRLDRREKLELKKRYESNLENIEKNKEIDSQVLGYNSKISSLELEKTEKIKLVERLSNEIKQHELQIDKNEEYIKTIKAEEEIRVIFEVYQRMVGKNGIIKMIMQNVMPLINSELDRLLSDTAPFKLEVDINDKKEVEFLVVKETDNSETIKYPISEGSGFEKTISSLALRMIMTKVSCLPKPNLIVLDEVLGKVANENLDLVGNFFSRCSEMFPNIFLITHNDLVKDWATKIITINKKNNVSSLSVN